MIDLSTAGSRIALYVDAAFTYNLRKRKLRFFSPKDYVRKKIEDSRVHAWTIESSFFNQSINHNMLRKKKYTSSNIVP